MCLLLPEYLLDKFVIEDRRELVQLTRVLIQKHLISHQILLFIDMHMSEAARKHWAHSVRCSLLPQSVALVRLEALATIKRMLVPLDHELLAAELLFEDLRVRLANEQSPHCSHLVLVKRGPVNSEDFSHMITQAFWSGLQVVGHKSTSLVF